MKALTLLQPWATLVAIGAKKIETRSWRTHYRGPLAIHASMGMPLPCRKWCAEEPFRTILLEAGLPHWDPLHGVVMPNPPQPDWQALPRGKVLAVVTVADCRPTEVLADLTTQERSFGNYDPGRFGWMLDDVRAFPEPIPATGARGLWDWECSLEQLEQVGYTCPRAQAVIDRLEEAMRL